MIGDEGNLYWHWVRLGFDGGMFVVIWATQLYAYPNLKRLDADDFVYRHRRYMQRISYAVIPLMIGQLTLGMWLALSLPERSSFVYLGLILAAWLLTGFVMAPIHRRLQSLGKDMRTLNRLLGWNWSRVICWTAILFL